FAPLSLMGSSPASPFQVGARRQRREREEDARGAGDPIADVGDAYVAPPLPYDAEPGGGDADQDPDHLATKRVEEARGLVDVLEADLERAALGGAEEAPRLAGQRDGRERELLGGGDGEGGPVLFVPEDEPLEVGPDHV